VFYLDTSALLKLLWPEPESEAVLEHVTREDVVVVSELAELETEIQLRAARLAGRYREAAWRRLRAKLAEFRETEPFAFRPLPGSLSASTMHPVGLFVGRSTVFTSPRWRSSTSTA
jgi:uncharacterized protein with PIN domain